MKTIDILKQKHTVLGSTDGYFGVDPIMNGGYTQKDLTLECILFGLSEKYKNEISILRQFEYHSKKQSYYKSQFPVWFVGGTFPIMKTEDKDIISYSNILCIDIDKKDNPDINMTWLKEEIFKLPYVFVVSDSITGQGIYVLILTENGEKTKDYYSYLAKLFTKKYNIKVDKQCTNIGRKRYISYDANIMIKDYECDIKPWKLYDNNIKEETKQPIQRMIDYKPKEYKDNNLAHKAIELLVNNGFSIDDFNCKEPYSTWYHIACDFRHFDDGYTLFEKFSNNSSKYNDNIKIIRKKWDGSKIEQSLEDISKKWCGIAKRKYGVDWYRI